LWVAFFDVLAWLVVANWGLSFWPSVALFTVYTAGIAIPLALTLGLLIPWGLAVRRERAELERSSHPGPSACGQHAMERGHDEDKRCKN
jgi:hypothetical protein